MICQQRLRTHAKLKYWLLQRQCDSQYVLLKNVHSGPSVFVLVRVIHYSLVPRVARWQQIDCTLLHAAAMETSKQTGSTEIRFVCLLRDSSTDFNSQWMTPSSHLPCKQSSWRGSYSKYLSASEAAFCCPLLADPRDNIRVAFVNPVETLALLIKNSEQVHKSTRQWTDVIHTLRLFFYWVEKCIYKKTYYRLLISSMGGWNWYKGISENVHKHQ